MTVSVFAEAPARLRVRAETAWAAAEDEAEDEADDELGVADLGHPGESAGAGTEGPASPSGQQLDGGTTVTEAPKSYELTPRHEQLLATFGEALSNIPDDLLWDGLQGEHSGDLPPRWID